MRYRVHVRPGDSYLVPGDIHFPVHDPAAVDAMVSWFEGHYRAPHHRRGVVFQGDTLDCWGSSRYPKAARRLHNQSRLADEVRAARPLLEWAGDQPLRATMILGNHEDRLNELLDGHPELHGASGASFGALTGLDTVPGLEILGHGDWVCLGDAVAICHGDADRFPRKAAAVAAKYPDQVTLWGHTHHAEAYYLTVYGVDGRPHVRGAVNVGHLSLVEEQEYTADPNWQQGFAVVEFFGDRGDGRPFFRVEQHMVLRDRAGRAVVA